jgi:hypothetical protein
LIPSLREIFTLQRIPFMHKSQVSRTSMMKFVPNKPSSKKERLNKKPSTLGFKWKGGGTTPPYMEVEEVV